MGSSVRLRGLLVVAAVCVLATGLCEGPALGQAGHSSSVHVASSTRASRPACTVRTAKVKPRRARISALGTTFRVVRVKRTKDGEVGTPPVTKAGKKLVGWDPQRRPGAGNGSVIVDAHTWPDGSALGNELLHKLKRGGLVTLSNGHGKGRCYRITKRHSYPRDKVPTVKMFRTWGAEQLVIVVCSGKRRGPGDWLRRTVWFGTPVARA